MLRESPVMRDISRSDLFFRACKCRILPIMSICLLYTSDAADERSSVDLGGRRIIKKKKIEQLTRIGQHNNKATTNKTHSNNT